MDVYYVSQELYKKGHDLCLFFPQESVGWERGQALPDELTFPSRKICFNDSSMTVTEVSRQFRHAVDQFRPDLIFLTQGYFLKIPLILALQDYKILSRCYAHEVACHKDILRFRNNAPCPNAYLLTPDECRRCALTHLAPEIRREQKNAWTREYLATRAWSTGYYDDFVCAMKQLHGVVVTTEHMREQVLPFQQNIHVVPHGVDCELFSPKENQVNHDRLIIVVPGRMEDPAKGFSVLLDAANHLAASGWVFDVLATVPEGHPGPSWLKPIGKRSYADMPTLYRSATLCVVPSIWDEPFGLVALEAMASGVPVCASRVGGLQDIVVSGETGLLFERGDSMGLASQLKLLLGDPKKCRLLGEAGRHRALAYYRWDHIVTHYIQPILEKAKETPRI